MLNAIATLATARRQPRYRPHDHGRLMFFRMVFLAAILVEAVLVSPALGHSTAPTNLIVTGSTETSVSLDWKQDYADSYDGYYVRVDGGARVRYPLSKGTVVGLQAGTSHQFCVTIDLTSSSHPDESDAACLTHTPAPYPRFTWTKSTSTQAEFDNVRSLGFTHAMVDPDPAQLARLAAAGLRAVLWGGNYDDTGCAWNWSDATFTQKVNAAKASPYIGLVDVVFVADEPHSAASGGCAASPQHMRERVALSRSLLPAVQTMISENRSADFGNLANIADIFAPVRYPCSYASGCVLSKIDQHVAAMTAAGVTKWWAVVQSFREPYGGYYRAPTATELRQIIDRWKSFAPDGLFAYAWGDGCCGDDIGLRDLADLPDLPDSPDLWSPWRAENAGSLTPNMGAVR
jgi:hypothetical protein